MSAQELEPGQARITHPDAGVEDAVVPASAVPHWERAGWSKVGGEAETWPQELQRFEGQEQVRIYHPELDRYETVAESAVAQHRSQGWWRADEWDAAQVAQGFDGKTLEELREIARDRGLKVSGTKDELLARLQGAESDTENQAGDEPAPSEEE